MSKVAVQPVDSWEEQRRQWRASVAAHEQQWAQDERNREFKQMVGAGWQNQRVNKAKQVIQDMQQRLDAMEKQAQESLDTYAEQQLKEAKETLSVSQQIYKNLLSNKDLSTGLGTGVSASGLRFAAKFLKLLEAPGEAVGGILKTLAERGVGYELVSPAQSQELPALSVKHGLRVGATTKPVEAAAKSFGKTLENAIKRVSGAAEEGAVSKLPAALKWLGKTGVKVVTGVAEAELILEGVWDVGRVAAQYKDTVEKQAEAATQTQAMREALRVADLMTRRLAVDVSQFPEDIRNLERERSRLDTRVKRQSWLAEQLELKSRAPERDREVFARTGMPVGQIPISAFGLTPIEANELRTLIRARDENLAALQKANQALTEKQTALHVAQEAVEATENIKAGINWLASQR